MKGIRYRMIAAGLLWCLGAAAQDSIGTDNFRYVDTAVAADEEGTMEDADLENRIRYGNIPHSFRDNQVPGEWSDGAQTRLSVREVSPETMRSLRSMKSLQYKQEQKAEAPNWATRTLQWILLHINIFQQVLFWLLGILLLAIIVLFIRRNDLPVFRWSRRRAVATEEAVQQHGPVNYDALAQAAIAAGNLREAVRLRYLQTLQSLENRRLIAPGKDKTNMDYLRELSATGWHKPFAALTLHYEYVWYGELPLSTGQFSQLDEQFAAFKNSLR